MGVANFDRLGALTDAQHESVAAVGHPLRACKMTVMNIFCAFRLSLRVKAKDNARGFLPVGTLGACIKQTNVSCEMTLIILAYARGLRRRVEEGRDCHLRTPTSASLLRTLGKRSPATNNGN
jgi:hypothetical protein